MASTAVPSEAAVQGPQRVLLLAEHPDLAVHVDAEHRDQARATVAVPVLTVARGQWDQATIGETGRHAFGAVVLRGLMARTLDIGNHPGLELYGPGDVIGASLLQTSVLPAGESWAATTPTQLAILDDEFLHAVRRWPRLVTGLFDQMQQQRDRLGLQLVIAEQPRVEDRLLALFWLLSERFGHVGPDGIVVALKLTHEALGRLIGAQRPTVTLALKALRARGAVERRPDGTWLLTEQPQDTVVDAASLPISHAPVPVDVGDLEERAPAAREEAREMKRAASASLRR